MVSSMGELGVYVEIYKWNSISVPMEPSVLQDKISKESPYLMEYWRSCYWKIYEFI